MSEYSENMNKITSKNFIKVKQTIENRTKQQYQILDKICISNTGRSLESFDFLFTQPINKVYKNLEYWKTLFFKNFKKNYFRHLNNNKYSNRFKSSNDILLFNRYNIFNIKDVISDIDYEVMNYFNKFYNFSIKEFKELIDIKADYIIFDLRKDQTKPLPSLNPMSVIGNIEFDILASVMNAASFFEDYEIDLYDNSEFWKFYNYLKHNSVNNFQCKHIYIFDTHTIYNCLFNIGNYNDDYEYNAYQLNYIIGVNNNSNNIEYFYPISIDYTD